MIENINDFMSLASLIILIIGGFLGFVRLNRRYKKDEDMDEYYRDLI